MSTPPTDPDSVAAERRVDARRNYEQLVEQAIRVLGDDPSASLQDIAAAAGLHRATLHRHFRSREDLLEVLRTRAAGRMLANLRAAADPDVPADVALAGFTRRGLTGALPDQLWRIGTFYGPGADEHRDEIADGLAAFFGRMQEAGAARSDMAPELVAAVWSGTATGMLPLVHDGALGLEAAVDVILAAVRGEAVPEASPAARPARR